MELLRQFYNGKILPYEQKLDCTPEQQAVSLEEDKHLEYWRQHLGETEYQKLDQLIDTMNQASFLSQEGIFVYGFRLGAILMMEVLDNKDKLLCTFD